MDEIKLITDFLLTKNTKVDYETYCLLQLHTNACEEGRYIFKKDIQALINRLVFDRTEVYEQLNLYTTLSILIEQGDRYIFISPSKIKVISSTIDRNTLQRLMIFGGTNMVRLYLIIKKRAKKGSVNLSMNYFLAVLNLDKTDENIKEVSNLLNILVGTGYIDRILINHNDCQKYYYNII